MILRVGLGRVTMKLSYDQARQLCLTLGELLEIFEEVDHRPEILISRLEAMIDDIAIKVDQNTPDLPFEED